MNGKSYIVACYHEPEVVRLVMKGRDGHSLWSLARVLQNAYGFSLWLAVTEVDMSPDSFNILVSNVLNEIEITGFDVISDERV